MKQINSERFPIFDLLRLVAMILMAIYHFCFDLNTYDIIQGNFNFEEFWLIFRAIIMSSFTILVGVSFYLAGSTYSSRGYQKRLLQIFASAAAISIGTYFFSPIAWIYFGILHFIFFASLLAPTLYRFPKTCGILAWVFILLPMFWRDPIFQQPILVLTGLAPLKPITADFAPIFPWFGTVLLGVWIGFIAKKYSWKFLKFDIPKLSNLGRHSLVFYLLHQAILFPLAWAISKIVQ